MSLNLLEGRSEELTKLLGSLRNWDKQECVDYLKMFISENSLKISTLLTIEQIDNVFESMSVKDIKSRWLIPLFQNADSVNQIFSPTNFN